MSTIRTLAKQLAAHGRNGDTTLVHMQPIEVYALERLTGKRATTNPQTGMKEGFAFLIPLITALAGIGASAASSAISNKMNDKKDTAESASDYIKAQGQKAKENYKIPLLQLQQATQTPGYIPGLSGEQRVAPIRSSFGWASPGGQMQLDKPPGYAEGGMIPEQQEAEQVYKAVVQGLRNGQLDQNLINRFIEIWGMEELQKLQSTGGAPQQQAQPMMAGGGLLRGPGGGMDDLIRGRVGNQEVALSGDEYIVPADATSKLGAGSSTAGGRVLDAMVARIRAQTAGAKQAPKPNLSRVMPA